MHGSIPVCVRGQLRDARLVHFRGQILRTTSVEKTRDVDVIALNEIHVFPIWRLASPAQALDSVTHSHDPAEGM